jgi:hypothetical protein
MWPVFAMHYQHLQVLVLASAAVQALTSGEDVKSATAGLQHMLSYPAAVQVEIPN